MFCWGNSAHHSLSNYLRQVSNGGRKQVQVPGLNWPTVVGHANNVDEIARNGCTFGEFAESRTVLSNNFELDGGFWVLEGWLVGGDVTFNFDTTNALV